LRHDYRGFKGDPRFVRDDQAQKSFSKLRSSIGASIYAWRANDIAQKLMNPQGRSPQELQQLQIVHQRMIKEADFAFRQAFAFCPYSPEAVFHYVNLLVNSGRADDALLIAETCHKLDPYNGQMAGLVEQLRGFKGNDVLTLENEVRANPTNFQKAFDLAAKYLQLQQPDRAVQILDQVLNNPHADIQAIYTVARAYSDMRNFPKLEETLEKLVKVAPTEPEAWYDLAALKAALNKSPEALQALRKSLDLSAQRLQKDPKTLDMRSNALADPRFNSFHDSPEFKAMTAPRPP
jgi:tetratricopeptide (TPR) repeat protein